MCVATRDVIDVGKVNKVISFHRYIV
jgi:hypothetical protein